VIWRLFIAERLRFRPPRLEHFEEIRQFRSAPARSFREAKATQNTVKSAQNRPGTEISLKHFTADFDRLTRRDVARRHQRKTSQTSI
jgi:hypothetical protein